MSNLFENDSSTFNSLQDNTTASQSSNSLNWGLEHGLFILQIAQAIFIIVTNFSVILLFNKLKNDKQNKIPNYLLYCQSIADLCPALVTILEAMYHEVQDSQPASPKLLILYLIYIAVLEYSLILALSTLVLGAVERYICITKPFYHRSKITKYHVKHATIMIWIFSLIPPCLLLTLMNFKAGKVAEEPLSVRVYSYIFDFIMLCLIIYTVVMLMFTLKVAKSSRKKHRQLTQQPKTSKRDMRVVLILILMTFVYIATLLPFTIGRVLYDSKLLTKLTYNQQTIFTAVCHSFYKASALFNPFATMFLKQDYFKLLKVFLKINQRTGDNLHICAAERTLRQG